MQVDLSTVSNVSRSLGFRFISALIECILEAANPDTPPSGSDFLDEINELVGTRVLVTTSGGEVSGLLVSVQTDYIVVNAGDNIALIRLSEIEGISDLSREG